MTEAGDRSRPGAPGRRPPSAAAGARRCSSLVVVLVRRGRRPGRRPGASTSPSAGGSSSPRRTRQRDPAAVPAPPGLELPDAGIGAPGGAPLGARGPVARDVRRALGRLPGRQAARASGSASWSWPTRRGRVPTREGPAVVTPASTMKLLTGLAALEAVGARSTASRPRCAEGQADHARRRWRPVAGPDGPTARLPPAGRPDGWPADAARALRGAGTRAVRLGYDDSLFTGPAGEPAWQPDYLPDDVVSPITALWVDEGRAARRASRPGPPTRRPPPPGSSPTSSAPARHQGPRSRRATPGAAGGVPSRRCRAPPLDRDRRSTSSRSATTRAPRCWRARWPSPRAEPASFAGRCRAPSRTCSAGSASRSRAR